MSEQPEHSSTVDVLLFRRLPPDAVDRTNNRPLNTAFRLRPSRGERALSFYDAALVTPQEVLTGAPGENWVVASVPASALLDLGFEVSREPVGSDRLGLAHVSAFPPETVGGQIPAAIRQAIAFACEWADGADPEQPPPLSA